MLGITSPGKDAAPESAGVRAPSLREDLRMLAYWVSLGGAAGGLGGALVGGIGGRLLMFILRVTSSDSVRGLESDDGFTIGRFDLMDTAQLILVTAVMGATVGLVVVAGRPFFPKRGMPLAWGLAGAITGGALLVHRDGVDFTALEPHWLALTFFVTLPAIGAGFIAWLTEAYPRFWWRRRTLTALAALTAVPAVVFLPVLIFTLVIAGLWLLAMRSPEVRTMPALKPVRVLATVVFGSIVMLGLLDLIRDARAIV